MESNKNPDQKDESPKVVHPLAQELFSAVGSGKHQKVCTVLEKINQLDKAVCKNILETFHPQHGYLLGYLLSDWSNERQWTKPHEKEELQILATLCSSYKAVGADMDLPKDNSPLYALSANRKAIKWPQEAMNFIVGQLLYYGANPNLLCQGKTAYDNFKQNDPDCAELCRQAPLARTRTRIKENPTREKKDDKSDVSSAPLRAKVAEDPGKEKEKNEQPKEQEAAPTQASTYQPKQ